MFPLLKYGDTSSDRRARSYYGAITHTSTRICVNGEMQHAATLTSDFVIYYKKREKVQPGTPTLFCRNVSPSMVEPDRPCARMTMPMGRASFIDVDSTWENMAESGEGAAKTACWVAIPTKSKALAAAFILRYSLILQLWTLVLLVRLCRRRSVWRVESPAASRSS